MCSINLFLDAVHAAALFLHNIQIPFSNILPICSHTCPASWLVGLWIQLFSMSGLAVVQDFNVFFLKAVKMKDFGSALV